MKLIVLKDGYCYKITQQRVCYFKPFLSSLFLLLFDIVIEGYLFKEKINVRGFSTFSMVFIILCVLLLFMVSKLQCGLILQDDTMCHSHSTLAPCNSLQRKGKKS